MSWSVARFRSLAFSFLRAFRGMHTEMRSSRGSDDVRSVQITVRRAGGPYRLRGEEAWRSGHMPGGQCKGSTLFVFGDRCCKKSFQLSDLCVFWRRPGAFELLRGLRLLHSRLSEAARCVTCVGSCTAILGHAADEMPDADWLGGTCSARSHPRICTDVPDIFLSRPTSRRDGSLCSIYDIPKARCLTRVGPWRDLRRPFHWSFSGEITVS